MRQLSSTLSAAQKSVSRTPYVKLEASAKITGVVRLDWERLYTGSEDEYYHGITMPGDGSLVRTRITPPGDARKLYRQRVADPGPSSDFSTWSYTGQYGCVVVATASQGAEVSIFWINSSKEIRRIKSTDNGDTWSSPELIDYTPSTSIKGLAAAYKSNGDLAIFFADGSTLYVKKHVGGNWQSKSAWNKTTGNLSGVAAVYDADWNLLITGQDSDDNYKLWSLVYGDGGDVSVGTWSTLKELVSAPSGGDFEYTSPFLDEPDVYRGFHVEKFTGSESYNRPFWSHTVPDTGYNDSLWREPIPLGLSIEYGLAIAHHGDYCWLANPAGVWRARLSEQSIVLTDDVISVRQEAGPDSGRLTVELRNDDGRYASPGTGTLSVLDTGCQLELGLGYVTSQGNEVSTGMTFWLEDYGHTSSGGRACLVLQAPDSWCAIERWHARHQFRWNKDSNEMSVKDILGFVLARVGLTIEVKSASSVITSYYPDFAINPGNRGDEVISRLLSFVPDVLFLEGGVACIVNPRSTDNSDYSYGQDHAIFEGSYRTGAWAFNRVQVEGYDTVGSEAIIVDSFEWDQIEQLHDRLVQVEDRNLDTVARAVDRGKAYLRKAEMESVGGTIRVPVNCGQQLYDVIDITDARAGMSSAKRRVVAIAMVYRPRRGEYEQRLSLGAV
jgi:hypothetical protein